MAFDAEHFEGGGGGGDSPHQRGIDAGRLFVQKQLMEAAGADSENVCPVCFMNSAAIELLATIYSGTEHVHGPLEAMIRATAIAECVVERVEQLRKILNDPGV